MTRPVALVVVPGPDRFQKLTRDLEGYDRGRLLSEFEFKYLDSFSAAKKWYQDNCGRFVAVIVQAVNFSSAEDESRLLDYADVKCPVPDGFDNRTLQGFLIYASIRQHNIDRIAPVLFVSDEAEPESAARFASFVIYPGHGSCLFVRAPSEGDRQYCEIAERIDSVALRPLDSARRKAWSLEHGMVVGRSRKMASLVHDIERIGPSDAIVLLLGGPGVGKELVANALHRSSHRYVADDPARDSPLTVNIAALDRNLIEDELFGHQRGAFTGAAAERKGIFETAEGSSVFLDEIGDIGDEIQLKLLRAMEYRRIRRLGSSTEAEVDMRIIAATNRSVEELQSGFRPDFYSRLVQHCISVPSLRERWEDEGRSIIAEDLEEFFDYVVQTMNQKPRHATANHARALEVEPAAVNFLHRLVDDYITGKNNLFHGNMRTLRNVIERGYERALYDGSLEISVGHLISTIGIIRFLDSQVSRGPLVKTRSGQRLFAAAGTLNLRELERQAVVEALTQTDGSIIRAATLLGIHRDTLRRMISKLEP